MNVGECAFRSRFTHQAEGYQHSFGIYFQWLWETHVNLWVGGVRNTVMDGELLQACPCACLCRAYAGVP